MERASLRGMGLFGILAGALLSWAIWDGSPYGPRVVATAGTYALLILGYHFIFGQAGALSLAQGTFFGLGAYVTAVCATRWGLGFEITFPLAILLPSAVAMLVAGSVLRLASHYFALATLGIAQVALLIATSWQDVTGGATGLSGLPGIVLFGMAVPRGWPLAAFVWGLVGLGVLLADRIAGGVRRLAYETLREDPNAAAASGIGGARLRFLAFALSAAYGGAAGALHAHTVRVVSAQVLDFGMMITCLAMAVIGGRKRIAGALIGATLLVLLPEGLRFLADYSMLIYGVALLVTIVAAPDGIAGLLGERAPAFLPQAAPPPPKPAKGGLDLRDISKRFGGVIALDGVTLGLRPGEILGLIGPNGSGKTTLVNIATGFERADRGKVGFAGETLSSRPPDDIARRGIARTFQTPALVPGMNVLDTVAVAGGSSHPEIHHSRILARAAECLERMGIGTVAATSCGDLPPGAQRSVEIARALALDPSVLLLDEPAAGLNETEQSELGARLRVLAARGLAILVVEHNMPFLLGLADRVICLDRGRIIAEGTAAAIQEDPKVIAAYFGTEP